MHQLFVALAFVGCTVPGLGADDGPRRVVPPPIVEGVTFRAVVTTAPRERPSRFAANVPPVAGDLRTAPWEWPSRTQLRRGVCGRSRYRDDVAHRVVFERQTDWLDVLGGCTPDMVDATYCPWALEVFADEPLAHLMLVDACANDPAVAAAVAEPDSPDDWVTYWAQGVGNPSTERIVSIVEPHVVEGYLLAADVAMLGALAADASPDAGQALLALHRLAIEPDVRNLIGTRLWGRDDPEMQAAYNAACTDASSDWCEQEVRDYDAYSTLLWADFDVARAIAVNPTYQGALLAMTEECAVDAFATTYGSDTAIRCLVGLARYDAERARQLIESAPLDAAPEGWAGVARSLNDVSGTVAALEEAGFGPFLSPDVALPIEHLVHSGQARLWSQAGYYDPDRAAWGLAELIEFARLVVDSSVLTWAAGEPSDTRQPRRVYLAWMDGLRFRALGAPVDEAHDLRRIVAFVNALLHHRDADERLAIGAALGQLAIVRGRPASLRALADQGLLIPEDPPE
ncbi:MAG: hypothetical protein AAGA48_21130 [Myxococcota bacterium]